MKTKVTNFKDFGKDNFAAMRKEMMDALNKVGEQYGVQFKSGNISYSDTFFNVKITANVITEGGNVMSAEAETFKHLAHLYDLKAEHLFKTVKLMGSDYQIMGLNSRSARMPIILKEVSTGRGVKAAAESIVSAINKNGIR